MEYNKDKVDEAVLALLSLTLHDNNHTWKSFDWDVMDRLYQKGLIENPKNKNKSVILTNEGMQKSEELFHKFFIES